MYKLRKNIIKSAWIKLKHIDISAIPIRMYADVAIIDMFSILPGVKPPKPMVTKLKKQKYQLSARLHFSIEWNTNALPVM